MGPPTLQRSTAGGSGRRREAPRLRSVLSYFESYFVPGGAAPYASHSTGQIARNVFDELATRGEVTYVGERPVGGLAADLFVGHFWSFADFCRRNRFARKIAVYPVADPAWTRRLLLPLAEEFRVPMPWWDLPPASFDHEATMELADLVLVVGNRTVLETFPARLRPKIRLLNYSVDPRMLDPEPVVPQSPDFCYVATHCDLRKGFMDVLETWSGIEPSLARIHVVGRLREPWRRLLAEQDNGSVVYHGWIDSQTEDYRRIIRSCRFAHVPTYSEGQMGTLLEVIHQGCVPVTTAIAGIDERVLRHCLVVDPRAIEEQRQTILDALSWSDAEYERRRDLLVRSARRHHTWRGFAAGVGAAIEELV